MSELLNNFNDFLLAQEGMNPVFLMLVALLGGLLSSISPCVLGLLPVNLAYIGTAHIENKKEAFDKAIQFVFGVSFVLTLLGVFANLAYAVFTEYRAPLNLAIGVFIILMAFWMLGLFKIPLPQLVKEVPEASPFVIGVFFALVSSPCSSPILFAVLTAASAINNIFWSMLIMFAFSIGYTAVIFFASLSAGLVKQLNFFKEHNSLVTRASGALLIILGAFYAYNGAVMLLAQN